MLEVVPLDNFVRVPPVYESKVPPCPAMYAVLENQLREYRLLFVPLTREASLVPSYVNTMPVSPTKSPRLPAGLNPMKRMFLPDRDNPVVLTGLNVVPL